MAFFLSRTYISLHTLLHVSEAIIKTSEEIKYSVNYIRGETAKIRETTTVIGEDTKSIKEETQGITKIIKVRTEAIQEKVETLTEAVLKKNFPNPYVSITGELYLFDYCFCFITFNYMINLEILFPQKCSYIRIY